METVNCYLLFVICNAKNPFPKTVNCQTVTPVTDDTDSLWGWHWSVLCGILLYGKTTHNTFEALWVVDMFLLT